MDTLRVGVLMGGRGSEREVSLNTGRTICDHLDTFRYTIVPLFQRPDGSLFILPGRFLHRGKTTDFEHRLETEAEKITWDSLKHHIDFMYTAMHGRYAEDGTLQGFLEVLGIPYLGSKVLASALGMDKIMQKKVLKAHNIPVAKDSIVKPHEIPSYVNDPEPLYKRVTSLGYPCIVKPHKEGSSMGVSVVTTQEELIPAIIKASQADEFKDQSVLIEEYLVGMEFTCITILDKETGDIKPLPPTEIVCEASATFFDYEQKYMPGRSTKYTPARCSSEMLKKIQDVSVATTKALGFRTISRIDGFVTKDGSVIITDPNSLAGMAPSSFVFRQAAEYNLSHTDFINHLIETELSQYGMLASILNNHTQRASMKQPHKKKIGVLMGGRNHEKEISLESGRNIFYKLSPLKYEPIALFVSQDLELYRIDQTLLVRNSTKEITLGLTPQMKVGWSDLPNLVDFVFIGLHGDVGENGSIQGTLEMLGIPYNGSSVLTSALCMDKYATGTFLASEGFDVPNQFLVEKKQWEANQEGVLSALSSRYGDKPVIIKPHDDGCSVMVAKAQTREEKIHALNAIFADRKSHALVEDLIKGMELTVGVMGNTIARALPPSQAVSAQAVLTMEEKFLPGAGENQTPALLPESALTFVKKTIEDVYTALNCKGYSRIDCFYQSPQQSPTGTERLIILEINSLPGLTPATCIFHQAAEIGLNPMEFIDLLVEYGFDEHSRRGIVVVATDTSLHSQATSMAMNPPALETL